jgi:hypothetical protein
MTYPTYPQNPNFMQYYISAAHVLRTMKEQGIVWLTIVDVLPDPNGKDIFIWDCAAKLDMSQKGLCWKHAVLLDSPNGNAILESALEPCTRDQIYFSNQKILKQ